MKANNNQGIAYKKVNMKKTFCRGKKHNIKRYKKTPKFIRDNLENQVAREKQKDPFHFTDSEPDDDLGMGIDISDLPFLDENAEDRGKDLIALTQDSVTPLFANSVTYEESKLQDGLAELKYSSFRPNQKEAIKRILFGRSTLLISSTGSGKSLCYQLPALLYWRYRKYMTIVVSPLLSLMEDQISNLPASMKAVALHSGHTLMHRRQSIEMLVNGEAQIAFISPEAIVGGVLSLDDLKNLPPIGFACIDEAHCLSEWSHNFRPAYSQFFDILKHQMNIKTFLGLTATATRATSNAIARCMDINPEIDIIGSTTIPDNLILSVSYVRNKECALVDLLKTQTFRIMPSIIVYCNRREETEHVASVIRTAMQNYSTLIEKPKRKNPASPKEASETSSLKDCIRLTWSSEAYHAGLSSDVRKKIQRQFIKGELRVVVATIAFGMGINKSNIRAIIHYDMPGSLENYVQEIGRAGRDGSPAQCHMFLKADKSDLYYQLRNIYSSVTERTNLRKLIDSIFKPCKCETLLQRTNLTELQTISAKNQEDPHDFDPWMKTMFPHLASKDTRSLNGTTEKENSPYICLRKSVVRKHRACYLHEVAFDIEKASYDTDLKSETIITLINQLQQAYPQLRIVQHTPIKTKCTLLCYKGAAQLETLAKNMLPVRIALKNLKDREMNENGMAMELSNRISFDVMEVAFKMGKSYSDVVRMLKKAEWELVEKTGKFRKSQIKVQFEGNSFHMHAVGDLNEAERVELGDFLTEYTRLFEEAERARMTQVFEVLKKHSMSVDQMNDKSTRLMVSQALKESLNKYFSLEQVNQLNDCDNIDNCEKDEQPTGEDLSPSQIDDIRSKARAFVSHHGRTFRPRTIAKIFQGISTPNYPAEYWGKNKLWWRTYLNVDFRRLVEIIRDELVVETKLV